MAVVTVARTGSAICETYVKIKLSGAAKSARRTVNTAPDLSTMEMLRRRIESSSAARIIEPIRKT